jgi:hypothetical protein
MAWSRVDFPEPFGPISVVMAPSGMVKDASSSAGAAP